MIAVATIAFGAFVVLVGGNQVFAVAPKTTTNNLNTLKISPIRSDITVAPGATGSVTVRVDNLTSSPMVISPIENDFVAGDEKGTPALILDADKFAPIHSLKRFMVPLQNITIPAKSYKDVKVTINVPGDAKPGGYFGALRFAPVTEAGTAQVNLNASAASIILMTVPGDAVEKLSLTDFQIKQGSKIDTIFQSANDLMVAFRMQNEGSIQEGPFGSITVKQGDKVIYSYKFNNDPPREMVLPDSARKWEVPLKDIGSFGNYTVVATFSYGKDNQTIEVTKSFWVVPVFVIVIAIAGTIGLIVLIVGIWLFLRNYKRRILKSHGRRSGGYRR